MPERVATHAQTERDGGGRDPPLYPLSFVFANHFSCNPPPAPVIPAEQSRRWALLRRAPTGRATAPCSKGLVSSVTPPPAPPSIFVHCGACVLFSLRAFLFLSSYIVESKPFTTIVTDRSLLHAAVPTPLLVTPCFRRIAGTSRSTPGG